MEKNIVYIYKTNNKDYFNEFPFNPSEKYPEYPFSTISGQNNHIYTTVRNVLIQSGLDHEKLNSKSWNPLKDIIKPGNTVLIKPNMVLHARDHVPLEGLISHSSIIRAVLDYVIIALNGTGKIIIGDAPLQSADFKEIIKEFRILEMAKFLNSELKRQGKQISIFVRDFRTERLEFKYNKRFGFSSKSVQKLAGDPSGYAEVDLGKSSCLFDIRKDYKKYRVTDYNPVDMKYSHNLENNKYLIPNSVIQADVVIHMPKLKTHRKAGITCCLKNNIGINGLKNWLPHHRVGSVAEGGDEYLYPNVFKKMYTFFNEFEDKLVRFKGINPIMNIISMVGAVFYVLYKKFQRDPYYEGSWWGNNTLWRTILDLNKILLYADKNGQITETPQRKRLYFVDGIISGEKEGPLLPTARREGLILFGQDPVLIDLAASELIGFNYKRIPSIFQAFKLTKQQITQFKPEELLIKSNENDWDGKSINMIKHDLSFKASDGWKGIIEKKRD